MNPLQGSIRGCSPSWLHSWKSCGTRGAQCSSLNITLISSAWWQRSVHSWNRAASCGWGLRKISSRTPSWSINTSGWGQSMGDVVLVASGIRAGYGKNLVLSNASVQVAPGEIVGLIGHNGSGKSTFLKVLAGMVRPRAGKVMYRGKDITGQSTAANVPAGIRLVPQSKGVLRYLSVDANLRLSAAYAAPGAGVADRRVNEVYALFPQLRERRNTVAGVLSGGQQRALSAAMGLATHPSLLLIDEPSIGLSPSMVGDLFALIKEIPQATGASIIMIEQNVGALLRIAGRVVVMKAGETIASKTVAELASREALMRLY
ncbi:MAG: ABC transporter ATP-binding protein [Castellaniella sp.]|nr:MAG: ABC transporter ATP-binding protein [Castellaniella sp.]